MERMTIANPGGAKYRASIERVGSFRIEANGLSIAIMGDLVDRLGAYEDIGLTPEEIRKMLKNGKIK